MIRRTVRVLLLMALHGVDCQVTDRIRFGMNEKSREAGQWRFTCQRKKARLMKAGFSVEKWRKRRGVGECWKDQIFIRVAREREFHSTEKHAWEISRSHFPRGQIRRKYDSGFTKRILPRIQEWRNVVPPHGRMLFLRSLSKRGPASVLHREMVSRRCHLQRFAFLLITQWRIAVRTCPCLNKLAGDFPRVLAVKRSFLHGRCFLPSDRRSETSRIPSFSLLFEVINGKK